MSKIKKIFALITCVALIFSLCSCGAKKDNQPDKQAKISIICTVFSEYDWVRNIIGDKIDNYDLVWLLDNGVDLHNYQPTVDDLVKISNCDMFIYIGGESDEWVNDALANAKNVNRIEVNLLSLLGNMAKEEETVEGMESEEEAQEDGEEKEYDEHIWLSLKNAAKICEILCERIASLDNENAEIYNSNTNNYITKLNDLDAKYSQLVASAKIKTLLFGDRFPFRYMIDDYGLDYFAAFSGCSAETEASFETISFLANKAEELGLKAVVTIEGSDNKIAQTIIQNTKDKNLEILSLNSMQGITQNDVENGANYISIMESNLMVLQKALEV